MYEIRSSYRVILVCLHLLGISTSFLTFVGSKSSIELGANRQLHEDPVGIGDRIRNSNEEDDDENEYECPDYIMPNSYSDKGSHLARWTSDDAISKVSLRTCYI